MNSLSRFRFASNASLVTSCLLLLPTLAHAHPEDELNAPPIAPQYRAIGGVVVGIGLVLVVGTLFYHSYRRRLHERSSQTPYVAKGLRPTIYAVLLIELLSAVALRFSGGKTSAAELERMRLRGNAQDASVEVAELLEKTPSAKRVPLLRDLADDIAPGLRFAAIDALGSQFKTGNEEVYEKAFRDNSSSVREHSLELLTGINPKRALPLLLAGLHDADTSLRTTAIQQLAQLHSKHPEIVDKSVVPTIMSMLGEVNPLDRASLTRLLSALVGKQWTTRSVDPQEQQEKLLRQWQEWWQAEQKSGSASTNEVVHGILPDRIDPAPPVALSDVNGQAFNLSSQRGRVTMLNFWGTWCGPCRVELPDLKEVYRLYQGQPFDLLGLALNEPDDAEGLKKRAREMGVPYRQAICTRAVQRDYGEITAVPVTVLIDKQGRVRYRWEGGRDLKTFQSAIDRLLKE